MEIILFPYFSGMQKPIGNLAKFGGFQCPALKSAENHGNPRNHKKISGNHGNPVFRSTRAGPGPGRDTTGDGYVTVT